MPRTCRQVFNKSHNEHFMFSAKYWLDYGLECDYDKNIKQALEAFEKAIRINPRYVDAWLAKGHALKSMGKYTEAMVAYDKVISLERKNLDAWFHKAQYSSYWSGTLQDTLKILDYLIKLEPNNAYLWGFKFTLMDYESPADQKKVLKALNKAIKIIPDFTNAWLRKSDVLNSMGRYKEALKTLEKVTVSSPIKSYYRKTRAGILVNLGRIDEAYKEYIKLLKRNPHDFDLCCSIASIYKTKNDIKNALKFIYRACSIDASRMKYSIRRYPEETDWFRKNTKFQKLLKNKRKVSIERKLRNF